MHCLWRFSLLVLLNCQLIYTILGESYTYLYVDENRSWNEALQICQNYGGRLARITSAEIENSFNDFFGTGGVWEEKNMLEYWIGLTAYKPEESEELTFFWSDCSELDINGTFLNVENEKKRENDENCMRMRLHDRKVKYTNCGDKRNFVCEIPHQGSCRFTEDSRGYYRPGVSPTSCTVECSQDVDCFGAVLASNNNTCFLLFHNGSVSHGGELTEDFIHLKKECEEEAQLIENPDDNGVMNDCSETPWLPCHGYTLVNESLSTALVSSTAFSSTAIDIKYVTRIVINEVNIQNVTCTLETSPLSSFLVTSSTSYINATSSAAWKSCSSPVIRNDLCATSLESDFHIVCNSSHLREEMLEREIQELVKNLTVKAQDTAAYQNQFKSAEDSRPSSKTVGVFGAVFIAIPMALVIIADLPRYYTFVKNVYNFINAYHGIKPRKVYVEKIPDLFSGTSPIYSSDVTEVSE